MRYFITKIRAYFNLVAHNAYLTNLRHKRIKSSRAG